MGDKVERRLDSKDILVALEMVALQSKANTDAFSESVASLSKDINKLCALQQVSEEKHRTIDKRLEGMYRRVDKHTDSIAILNTGQAGCQKDVFAAALQLIKGDMVNSIGDINISVEKKIAAIRLESAVELKDFKDGVRKDVIFHVGTLWTALLAAIGIAVTAGVKLFGKG